MSQTPLIESLSHASRMREEGQTMAEYGVVLTMITIGVVTALALFSEGIELSILRVVRLISEVV